MKSAFKKLFGTKKSNDFGGSNGKQHNATLEKLREMEELLQLKQTHLEKRIEEQLADARKHGTKNRRAALLALRRKKRLEAELTKIDNTLTTIELQREALESAKNNMQILGAMREAATALKNAQKQVSVDKIYDIMDDVSEQQQLANEISEAMSHPIGSSSSSVDDDDLEKELEALEQEELDKALLHVEPNTASSNNEQPASSQSPNGEMGPSSHKKSAKDADPDEAELQELAAWSQ